MKKLEVLEENEKSQRNKGGPVVLQTTLAPLAIRVDLTFESNRDEATHLEGLLVASSMRTVFSVPGHREYLRGGYPSEPFLAEAAARELFGAIVGSLQVENRNNLTEVSDAYMHEIPKMILKWFKSGLISKGQRGELVARILITLAHDTCIINKCGPGVLPPNFSQKVPVVDFLRSLVSDQFIDQILDAKPENMDGITLKEAFEGAFIHGTQFIKAGDSSVITDEGCMWALIRGAFIQCSDNQAVMDLVIPVVMKDAKLNRWIVTAIFIQIKNRLRKQPIHIDVEKMGYFSTGPSDLNNNHEYATTKKEADSRPYITIAMELGVQPPPPKPLDADTPRKGGKGKVPAGAQTPSTPQKTRTLATPLTPANVLSSQPERYPMSRDVKKGDQHPRYAIKITGCSPTVYKVVRQRGDYNNLLAQTDIFSEHPRKDERFISAVKQMKPFWAIGKETYGWGEPKAASRIGAGIGTSSEAPTDELEEDGVHVQSFGEEYGPEGDDFD